MVLTVDFVLDGQDYTAINGGPQFTFNEAISLLINCADQDEVDYYWEQARPRAARRASAAGSRTGTACRGRSCPAGMDELLNDPDPARGQRAMKAMLGMKKIDIAAIRAAADAA